MADSSFEVFASSFLSLLLRPQFRDQSLPKYLQLAVSRRSNDEASIVDAAIVAPLLGLLGFEPGQQVYNRQRAGDRPDFLPTDPLVGACFAVEDKNTSLDLSLDLSDPGSHLSQLAGYVRGTGLKDGWLCNGRRLMVWRFEGNTATSPVNLDLIAAATAWENHLAASPIAAEGATVEELREALDAALAPEAVRGLRHLWDEFRRESFSLADRIADSIAVDPDTWKAQALPLGTGSGNEAKLTLALQELVRELQAQARRVLDGHLARYGLYREQTERISESDDRRAGEILKELRDAVLPELDVIRPTFGLEAEDIGKVAALLARLEEDARTFRSPKELLDEVLAILNAARARKHGEGTRAGRALPSLDDVGGLRDTLRAHAAKAFAWHRRQATLRQSFREAIEVHDSFTVWNDLVQETMLGGLDEDGRRNEFALQASYVVFIRLLLIRVCEDKGIFANRFLSDGGLAHWREDIKRYLLFANGNPYAPLLDMAYANAQNIYAHFFTGREVFNWYQLDKRALLLALQRLSRFDFAGVDSDIVGTVYSTYVSREERRNKGQFYTPPVIVDYILDGVGYTSGAAIIGENKKIIDPACGSGTFLVRAARRLVSSYLKPVTSDGASTSDASVPSALGLKPGSDPQTVLEQVRANIYGFDLNPFACYLAEVNLLIQVLDLVREAIARGQRPKLDRFHIYNADALAKPGEMIRAAHYATLLAEENDTVDAIKRRAPDGPYAGGFAFVVANPPYGASLSPPYREMLREDYPQVFRGQADTYVFFYQLGLSLLARNGRLGFITPNTFLMNPHFNLLRAQLLRSLRLSQIVDLPRGIWPDVAVDCVLLFGQNETDEEKRRANPVSVRMMGIKDGLVKLTAREWDEELEHVQSTWIAHRQGEMNIRHDDLLQKIEDTCRAPLTDEEGNQAVQVLRLGRLTDSSPGIDPYATGAEGRTNLYIKPQREVPKGEDDWKPLLDGTSSIGPYEIRWNALHPHIKYGSWLSRPREPKYFDNPKLLVIRHSNRSMKRRLVAAYDESGFYNRKNYQNILGQEPKYSLKYLLALLNSSVLNFWYARRYLDVEVSLDEIRSLPVFPADAATQERIVALVDELLEAHRTLNAWRERGYIIGRRRDGSIQIEVPADDLVRELREQEPDFETVSLFDAQAIGVLSLPEACNLAATVSSNVFIPARHPQSLALRHPILWLDVPDDRLRLFLRKYLSRPQWRGQTWDGIKQAAQAPIEDASLDLFFAREAARTNEIQALLDQAADLDARIDEEVLALYGITDPDERARIARSVGTALDAETEQDSEDAPSTEAQALPDAQNGEEMDAPQAEQVLPVAAS